MTVKILPNDRGEPADKLADVELLFDDGVLRGLRLIGFSIWQRRGKNRTVSFPSRTYFIHGERRVYALLRPTGNDSTIDPVRRLILESYAEFEQRMAVGT
jgi:hypothetical protein